jgi:transposase
MISALAGQLPGLDAQLKAIEARLVAWHRQNQTSQLLATIPGIGPIGGTSFALKVPEPKVFRSGRHFVAWIGITPREHSTAGRQRLGRISKEGDEDLRRLPVLGATAVIQQAKPGRASPWLLGLLARKSKKVATLALANKMARIIWAMMISGEVYRHPKAGPEPAGNVTVTMDNRGEQCPDPGFRRGRRCIGAEPMSPAERQARHRAKLRRHSHALPTSPAPAQPPAGAPNQRRANAAPRPGRWAAAVATIVALQQEYRAWFENLPANLEGSRLADKLEAIAELDLEELQAIDPPRGYGRD